MDHNDHNAYMTVPPLQFVPRDRPDRRGTAVKDTLARTHFSLPVRRVSVWFVTCSGVQSDLHCITPSRSVLVLASSCALLQHLVLTGFEMDTFMNLVSHCGLGLTRHTMPYLLLCTAVVAVQVCTILFVKTKKEGWPLLSRSLTKSSAYHPSGRQRHRRHLDLSWLTPSLHQRSFNVRRAAHLASSRRALWLLGCTRCTQQTPPAEPCRGMCETAIPQEAACAA